MFSEFHFDVTNFEVCGFTKNTKILISWKRNNIFLIKKISHYTLKVIIWQKKFPNAAQKIILKNTV